MQGSLYKRGEQIVTVVSKGEMHLNTFSSHGSQHTDLHWNGVQITATLLFEGEGSYGGPITVFHDEQGNFFLAPDFEFNVKYTEVTV